MPPADPTPAQVHALVDAADRFRQAAPWDAVSEDQVFGILDPDSHELVLASITGQAGIVRGLSLFPGYAGRLSLCRMQFELLPSDHDELLLEHRALLCAFVRAPGLNRLDQRLFRIGGIEPRGRGSWPQFISYEPGYGSWTPNAAEARLMTIALEQSEIMARAIAQDPDLLERGHPGEYLVRFEQGAPGSGAWSQRWMRPPDSRDLRAPELDELTATRLARLPRAAEHEWEVDAMTGLGSIAEGPDVRPRVLRTLTVIERGSDFMLAGDPFEAPDFVNEVAALFTRRVLSIGHRPRRILVRDYKLRSLLANIAKAMDCKLLRVQYLPCIERAQVLLHEHVAARRR